MQKPTESPAERNSRAIRVAAKWYSTRVPKVATLLLTADEQSRAHAAKEGVAVLNMTEFAEQHVSNAEVLDLIAMCAPPLAAAPGIAGAHRAGEASSAAVRSSFVRGWLAKH